MQSILHNILTTIITYFKIFSPIILILYCINRSLYAERKIFRTASFSLIAILFSLLILIGLLIGNYHYFLAQYPALSKHLINLHVFSPYTLNQFPFIGPSIWIPSLLALLILIPSVRRRLSTILPFSAESSLHAITLSLSMILIILFLTNLVLGTSHLTSGHHSSEEGVMVSVWIQSLFLAFTGFVGVGWLSRLSLRKSFERLGITKVKPKQVFTGFGIGVSLSFFVIFMELLASHYGLIDPQITKSTDELIGPLFNSAFGILTLGLAAAIGEETIFRGALLPRFGIIYSSLLFALLHVHYGVSFQLVTVFLLGLFLSRVRQRHNTTISMVVHATYNMTLGIIGYIATRLMT